MQPRINIARLEKLLQGVNQFGYNPVTQGYNRAGYSDADMQARRWLQAQMQAAGLRTTMDAVGNVFGRYGPEDGSVVLTGSHLDTVPEGGGFDGVLGVCAALECVYALQEAGITPKIAIEVVATAEEEGRFGGMLGSQAISGQVSRDWIESATDANGIRLADALQAQGLNPTAVADCQRKEIDAFLELHIEQGPVLESRTIPIGIVDAVSGVCHLAVTLTGKANHSGTTPMELRADAFVGLAQTATRIPDIIHKAGTAQSRITIGKVDLEPNFPHTIAGVARFSVIIRDTDEAVMRALTEDFKQQISQAASRHKLKVEATTKSWLAPVALDTKLADLLERQATNLQFETLRMPSGAGHDAQTLQHLCPAGLIFVPSWAGISHSPKEWTESADIAKGAQLLLHALWQLSCDVDSGLN